MLLNFKRLAIQKHLKALGKKVTGKKVRISFIPNIEANLIGEKKILIKISVIWGSRG